MEENKNENNHLLQKEMELMMSFVDAELSMARNDERYSKISSYVKKMMSILSTTGLTRTQILSVLNTAASLADFTNITPLTFSSDEFAQINKNDESKLINIRNRYILKIGEDYIASDCYNIVSDCAIKDGKGFNTHGTVSLKGPLITHNDGIFTGKCLIGVKLNSEMIAKNSLYIEGKFQPFTIYADLFMRNNEVRFMYIEDDELDLVFDRNVNFKPVIRLIPDFKGKNITELEKLMEGKKIRDFIKE